MDLLEKHNLSPQKIIKGLGILILGLFLILLSFSLISGITNSIGGRSNYDKSAGFRNELMVAPGYDSASQLVPSLRNITGENGDYNMGDNAEDFEVTEYFAQIETRKLKDTCDRILELKGKDHVIFERSDMGDTNCDLKFKVDKENTAEVIELITTLDPRVLNETIHTIKKQIEDYTSEEEILKKKLEVMEETLSSALISYEEISRLAAQTRNADSLASVIESKIKIIERLSQEKIDTSAILDRLSRQKAEQLDKLKYTFFSVYIYENKFVDIDQLKDSWKQEVKSFVFNMNKVLQSLSIGLVSLFVYLFQYLLYTFIIVLVAKYVWKLLRKLWNK